jgi:ABC-type thiamine transport system ATPase subunit
LKKKRLKLLAEIFAMDEGETVDAIIQAIGAQRGAKNLPDVISGATTAQRAKIARYIEAVREGGQA